MRPRVRPRVRPLDDGQGAGLLTPLEFMNLFPEFKAPSWDGWRDVLSRVTKDTREFYVIAGRGSGKSRIVALIAACVSLGEYLHAPGERVYVGVFGPDRKQARITFSYIIGLLRAAPELEGWITHESKESVDLRHDVTIEVITASKAAPRGRSYALAIIEEAAFLPQEDSANPDLELVRAVRPALARVPGSLLAVVSSPYARRGILYEAWRRQEKEQRLDEGVVLVQASTLELNPLFDVEAIERARVEDPVAAATEYDAEFRSDVESFANREAVEACVADGVHEVKPNEKTSYSAFCDPAGGSGTDSFGLAIGHRNNGDVVVDAVREWKPRFSPEAVVKDMSGLLRRYRVNSLLGDRFAGEWVREPFRRNNIEYGICTQAKSDLYRDVLPLINSKQIRLLDNPRLIAQLVGLERRVGRGGRDSIDHAPGGHDDVANVVCGLAVGLSGGDDETTEAEVLW